MSIHIVCVIGLVFVFIVGTLRPINLGALALVMTFLVGSIFVGEGVTQMYSGFPLDLLVLLVGVTYLFGIAERNGTVRYVVEAVAHLVKDRRALIPWAIFLVAALPAMAGALGSAGVALLAPLAMRLAQRYNIDRRMIGLMVVHGAASGNFSPLNVLSAIVVQAVTRNGLQISTTTLFLGNLLYNIALAAVIYVVFGGLKLSRQTKDPTRKIIEESVESRAQHLSRDQVCTLLAILIVAVAAFVVGLNVGFVAFTAAVALHLIFPASSDKAEQKIAWGVVLLVCGVVTYVAAMQRYGTVDAVGHGIAGLSTPLIAGLLLCFVGAVTRQTIFRGSRLQIQSSLETSVHVEGYGYVFVIDEPLPVCISKTNRHAHPVIIFLAVDVCAADVVHAVCESCFRSSRYFEIRNLNPDWAIERLEPFGQVLSPSLFALILKRWRQIELHYVVGITRDASISIFVSEAFRIVFYDCSNPPLVTR